MKILWGELIEELGLPDQWKYLNEYFDPNFYPDYMPNEGFGKPVNINQMLSGKGISYTGSHFMHRI